MTSVTSATSRMAASRAEWEDAEQRCEMRRELAGANRPVSPVARTGCSRELPSDFPARCRGSIFLAVRQNPPL